MWSAILLNTVVKNVSLCPIYMRDILIISVSHALTYHECSLPMCVIIKAVQAGNYSFSLSTAFTYSRE